MIIYAVQEIDFYTEEYDNQKIRKLFLNLDDALNYVKTTYDIKITNVNTCKTYIENDEERGEVSVCIYEMSVL